MYYLGRIFRTLDETQKKKIVSIHQISMSLTGSYLFLAGIIERYCEFLGIKLIISESDENLKISVLEKSKEWKTIFNKDKQETRCLFYISINNHSKNIFSILNNFQNLLLNSSSFDWFYILIVFCKFFCWSFSKSLKVIN